ncbi:MAG: hypothetical protein ABR591_02890, partial [Candidatus Velthaea sp.]
MHARTPGTSPTFRRSNAALLLGAALAAAAPALAGADATVDAQAALARVRSAFRAQRRPAFVVYSLSRRDLVDGIPDFANSYALR